MNKTILFFGLGKMGGGMVARLLAAGHTVKTYDPSGAGTVSTIKDMFEGTTPGERVIFCMVPNSALDQLIADIEPHVAPGDIVVDSGNSLYLDSIRRAKMFAEKKVEYLDVGVSGGPKGARDGACILIGGDKATFEKIEPLFQALSLNNSYMYLGASGAGHFAKMVHNGIEYGMMQAIAEGFELLRASDFKYDLLKVAQIYNNGSVIDSRLIGWMEDGFKAYGNDLEEITSTVAHTGEGAWTVEAGKRMNISMPVIEASLQFRKDSAEHPRFAGKVLSTLRNMFGGHSAK